MTLERCYAFECIQGNYYRQLAAVRYAHRCTQLHGDEQWATRRCIPPSKNTARGTRRGFWAQSARLNSSVWAIRFWLDQHRRLQDAALFDLAIDGKLRGCDVVKVKIGDIVSGGRVRGRALVAQQ